MRLLVFALLLAPLPGLAQEPSPLSPNANSSMPQCGPAMDGQAMCRFGLIYECQFVSPTSMESRTGWRWKSDILRACDQAPAPADLPSEPGREPPSLTYAPEFNNSGSQPAMPPQSNFERPRHN
jgi:hypothetical protein